MKWVVILTNVIFLTLHVKYVNIGKIYIIWQTDTFQMVNTRAKDTFKVQDRSVGFNVMGESSPT